MRYFLVALLLCSVNVFAQMPIEASVPIVVSSEQPESSLEAVASTVTETALPRTAQFKKDTIPAEQFSIPYVLILLCLLAGGSWWWIKRRPLKNLIPVEDTALKIIKRQRLSAKTVLYVVQYREYELLIAEHAEGVTVLERMTNSSPKPCEESISE